MTSSSRIRRRSSPGEDGSPRCERNVSVANARRLERHIRPASGSGTNIDGIERDEAPGGQRAQRVGRVSALLGHTGGSVVSTELDATGWRRRPDSNRRIEVLQTSALDHLATSPLVRAYPILVEAPRWPARSGRYATAICFSPRSGVYSSAVITFATEGTRRGERG